MTMFNVQNSIFAKLNAFEKIIDIIAKLETPNYNGTERSKTDEWFRANNTDDVTNEVENKLENHELFSTHTDNSGPPKFFNSWINGSSKENINFRFHPTEKSDFRSSSPNPIECEEKFSFHPYLTKELKKMFAYHPLEGCICDVCSTLSKKFQISYVRKGVCIPAGSIVVLKENLIGTYNYFGHQRKFGKETISDEYCLNRREVGHNISLFNNEDTEIFIHCDAIEAVYIKNEKEGYQEVENVNIPKFNSLTLTNNPLPSKHPNLLKVQRSYRSNSFCDYSGNLHPAYSGHRRYSEYSDLLSQDFCNSPYPVFDGSTKNGSGHYIFNNFYTDV